MTSTNKTRFTITGGPSKFDLMLSLFTGCTVAFHLEGIKTPVEFWITMVQREDGSSESWNFQGQISHVAQRYSIKGYFSTKRRQGFLVFEYPGSFVRDVDDRFAMDRFIDHLRTQ